MLSTRHLRKSDYFGDVEQSPVHTSVVKNAERDAKNEEDVIVMVRENEASTPANIDACNQVKVFTPIQARGSTETPKSGGRRGRKSLAPKPNLSPSFESQHSEPKPLSRILRSNKSSERQNFGIDVENPEKEHGCKSKSFKRTQKDLETDSVGVTKSTDSATKTSSKSDDLMDVDQTPLRRTRKSVMFKILEEPLSATENVSCKKRKSLATESIPDVGNDTPKQSKRGRKSIVPEQHSGDISLTPRRMKHVNYNSPLHVTFEEGEILLMLGSIFFPVILEIFFQLKKIIQSLWIHPQRRSGNVRGLIMSFRRSKVGPFLTLRPVHAGPCELV